MLYAQNGATDAKLRHDEQGKIFRVSGRKVNRSNFSDLDPAGMVYEVGRSRSSRSLLLGEAAWSSPER